MKIRRVVTGHSVDGKAVVASDTEVEATTIDLAGLAIHRLLEADSAPTFPDDGSCVTAPKYFPPVGGFRFVVNTFRPESELASDDTDPSAWLEEIERKVPGVATQPTLGPGGMHMTDTIDLIYVMSGEIWLELDGGEEVLLRQGDTLVQSGTNHAWHNRGSEPCCIVAVIIGAHRH